MTHCASLHRTIAGVSEDYAGLRNNTAVAKLIEYTNHLTKSTVMRRAGGVEPLVLMLAPVAPHLAEEMWLRLGHTSHWRTARSRSPIRDILSTTPSNTRFRSTAKCGAGWSVSADAERRSGESRRAGRREGPAFLAGATPQKVIVVAGRLVNLVV